MKWCGCGWSCTLNAWKQLNQVWFTQGNVSSKNTSDSSVVINHALLKALSFSCWIRAKLLYGVAQNRWIQRDQATWIIDTVHNKYHLPHKQNSHLYCGLCTHSTEETNIYSLRPLWNDCPLWMSCLFMVVFSRFKKHFLVVNFI